MRRIRHLTLCSLLVLTVGTTLIACGSSDDAPDDPTTTTVKKQSVDQSRAPGNDEDAFTALAAAVAVTDPGQATVTVTRNGVATETTVRYATPDSYSVERGPTSQVRRVGSSVFELVPVDGTYEWVVQDYTTMGDRERPADGPLASLAANAAGLLSPVVYTQPTYAGMQIKVTKAGDGYDVEYVTPLPNGTAGGPAVTARYTVVDGKVTQITATTKVADQVVSESQATITYAPTPAPEIPSRVFTLEG